LELVAQVEQHVVDQVLRLPPRQGGDPTGLLGAGALPEGIAGQAQSAGQTDRQPIENPPFSTPTGQCRRLPLGPLPLLGGGASGDIVALLPVEPVVPLGQLFPGFGEPQAAQQIALVLTVTHPVGAAVAQFVLPEAEAAVLVDPVAQLLPVADQGLVGELDRLVSGQVVAGDQEPLGGQQGDQAPVVGADLGAGGELAGVLGALAGAHQLDEDAAHLLVASGVVAGQEVVGLTRQGLGEAADGAIAGMGETVAVAALPEFVQGGLEQGQVAGFVAEVADDGRGEPALQGQAGALGRLDDGVLECRGSHGAEVERWPAVEGLL
jgi:hypothetical protein